jgi:hypothetical protein
MLIKRKTSHTDRLGRDTGKHQNTERENERMVPKRWMNKPNFLKAFFSNLQRLRALFPY